MEPRALPLKMARVARREGPVCIRPPEDLAKIRLGPGLRGEAQETCTQRSQSDKSVKAGGHRNAVRGKREEAFHEQKGVTFVQN